MVFKPGNETVMIVPKADLDRFLRLCGDVATHHQGLTEEQIGLAAALILGPSSVLRLSEMMQFTSSEVIAAINDLEQLGFEIRAHSACGRSYYYIPRKE